MTTSNKRGCCVNGKGSVVQEQQQRRRRRRSNVGAAAQMVLKLKNLRPQLYSVTEYYEKSYLHSEQKQIYHYNVADSRLRQHVEKGNEDGLYISCVASATNLWAVIIDARTASIQVIGLESNSESFLVGMINSIMVFSQTSRGLTYDQKKIQASHVKSFINASVE
ncbi:Casein kinase 1-like protein HD16 [Camellia lanceoleosa]|uniref:Casein kinase 1-like protein HD16 n=1 Tax=Camellia lanceoleosa TaxID=1840588 RepID=A0ACC0FZF4_9ERIC|nr:Casein kinase 1-like protein HD16 [Camellia lanceoleosa]